MTGGGGGGSTVVVMGGEGRGRSVQAGQMVVKKVVGTVMVEQKVVNVTEVEKKVVVPDVATGVEHGTKEVIVVTIVVTPTELTVVTCIVVTSELICELDGLEVTMLLFWREVVTGGGVVLPLRLGELGLGLVMIGGGVEWPLGIWMRGVVTGCRILGGCGKPGWNRRPKGLAVLASGVVVGESSAVVLKSDALDTDFSTLSE